MAELGPPYPRAPMLGFCAFFCVLCACGDERIVPFGQETPEQPTDETPPEGDVDPDFEALESQALEGVENVTIEGATFAPEGGRLHALLTEDTDGDGDRDALAVVTEEVETMAEVSLVFGRHENDAFVTQTLATQRISCESLGESGESAGESTGSTTAAIRGPTSSRRIATIEFECGSEVVHVAFVLAAGDTPRLRESIALRGAAPTLTFPDIDEDGHEDLRAELAVADKTLTLSWLDRPGGLARDHAEPNATLEGAGENGMQLVQALCGEEAVIAIGGRWGMDCDPESTRRIRRNAALALAQDDLAAALIALDDATPEDEAALVESLRLPAVRAQRVDHSLPATPATRHAALAFADEQNLLDHATGVRVSLNGASIPTVAGSAIPSPDGQRGVRGVFTTPRGYEVRIAGASSGAFHGSTLASLSLERAPEREWLVLGWAPQGMLLFDGAARYFLGVEGDHAAALRLVEDDDALPAPLRGARVSQNGETWIAESPFGVLYATDGTVELWRSDIWDRDLPVLASALSPSGRRVAIARADGIFVLSKATRPVAPPTGDNGSENAETGPQ